MIAGICPTSRRRFLHGAAGAATGLVVGQRSLAADDTSRWRPRWILASALYGTFSLEKILPEVAKIGAEMIDLWPAPHGTQREEIDSLGEEQVRDMLTAAGVRLGGIACYRIGAFRLASEFALAERLGGQGTVLVATAPGDGTAKGDKLAGEIERFFEQLAPSVAAARATGGVIAIENHSNSLLQTPDAIRRFAELVPDACVGVALAPHHLPQDGELIATLARDLGPRLKFVYAQQHGKGAKDRLPKEDELLQLPGRGPLDFGPLMRELAAMRFAGPVEVFMHPVPRGVPILDTIPAITAEINRAQASLQQ